MQLVRIACISTEIRMSYASELKSVTKICWECSREYVLTSNVKWLNVCDRESDTDIEMSGSFLLAEIES
jgi:hypothetical protein